MPTTPSGLDQLNTKFHQQQQEEEEEEEEAAAAAAAASTAEREEGGRWRMGAPGRVVAAGAASTCKAALLMVLLNLGQAVFIILVRSLLASGGICSTALVVYEHSISSVVLSSLAFFLENKTRPPLSLRVIRWAFFLGFLQITLCQLLLTSSLRYITPSLQSSLLNTGPAVVFILAVASGQERFRFCDTSGQAKLWGTLVSAVGATMVVLSTASSTGGSGEPSLEARARLLGFLMVGAALLAIATFSLLLEWVAVMYPGDMTWTAMIVASGTLQTAAIGLLVERDPSAWRIKWSGSQELLTILYGGLVVTGLFYYIMTWCIHAKGPVFAWAFSPLLVVFSFLLEMLFFGATAHLWSIVGVMLVVGGPYILIYGKANEHNKLEVTTTKSSFDSVAGSNAEPLLMDKA